MEYSRSSSDDSTEHSNESAAQSSAAAESLSSPSLDGLTVFDVPQHVDVPRLVGVPQHENVPQHVDVPQDVHEPHRDVRQPDSDPGSDSDVLSEDDDLTPVSSPSDSTRRTFAARNASPSHAAAAFVDSALRMSGCGMLEVASCAQLVQGPSYLRPHVPAGSVRWPRRLGELPQMPSAQSVGTGESDDQVVDRFVSET